MPPFRKDLPLADGMEFAPVIGSTKPGAPNKIGWVVTYHDDNGISRLYLDGFARVLWSDLRPSHSPLFQPILDAVGWGLESPPPQ